METPLLLMKKGYEKLENCPITDWGGPKVVEEIYSKMLEMITYALEEGPYSQSCFECLTREALKQVSPPGSSYGLPDYKDMRNMARIDKLMKALGLLQVEIGKLQAKYPIDLKKEADSIVPPPVDPTQFRDEFKKVSAKIEDAKLFLGRNAYTYTKDGTWRGMEGPVITPIPREIYEKENNPEKKIPEVKTSTQGSSAPKGSTGHKWGTWEKPPDNKNDPLARGGSMEQGWGGMHSAETWIPPPCP